MEAIPLAETDSRAEEKKGNKNYLLAVLIIICILVLLFRFILFPTESGNGNGFEVEFPDRGIINIHDHIHRTSDADKWLDAMAGAGVSATVMVGSPEATFLLNSPPGFNNYSSNNDVIIWLEKISNRYICYII